MSEENKGCYYCAYEYYQGSFPECAMDQPHGTPCELFIDKTKMKEKE